MMEAVSTRTHPLRRSRRIGLGCLLLAGSLLSGCATYQEQSHRMMTNWRSGNWGLANQAAMERVQAREGTRDELVTLLEAGATARAEALSRESGVRDPRLPLPGEERVSYLHAERSPVDLSEADLFESR